MPSPPVVLSVNVGLPRTTEWAGRQVTSAIWKSPVEQRVLVAGVNVAGDDQADRRVHGGADKAVYAYASEDYAWWSSQLGTALAPGTFGDNLTTAGIDPNASVVGQRWLIGSAGFEVAQPREPCFKLGMRMGDARFIDQFAASGRSGVYLRIIKDGDVGAGDDIIVGAPPEHGLTIGELNDIGRDATRAVLERVASNPDVPSGYREWARRQLAR